MRFEDPPKDFDSKHLQYFQRLIRDLNQLDKRVNSKDVTLSRLRITDLPTSSSGLSAGDLWNDSGSVKVV